MKYTYQTDGPRGPPAFYWRKNMKHILSCSFGKDSIATALLALQHGEPLDELVYCEVMFSEEISGELPEHNRFIHETAIPYFEQRGIPTRVLRSEKTYLSCFYHVVTRGKTKGMLSGFPLSGRCTIQRDCKLPPIKAYVYYRFRGLSIVQGVLAGLRPAVIAMIASAGISLMILALYGQRTLPADLSSFDLMALVIFLAGFFVLRKWKPSPIKVMAGAAVAGVVLYSITA